MHALKMLGNARNPSNSMPPPPNQCHRHYLQDNNNLLVSVILVGIPNFPSE